MTEEFTVDSLAKLLESSLQAKAREYPHPTVPLVFRAESKGGLKIVDADKSIYPVDEAYLSSFKSVYADRPFKFVRLINWDFELNFEGKDCKSITLLSDYVAFFSGKNDKRQLKDCTFRVMICEKGVVSHLGKTLRGYLNRIGKRNIVDHCENVAEEFYTLVGFVGKRLPNVRCEKIIGDKTEAEKGQSGNVMDKFNKEGLKVLQKLRNFVTKEKVLQFAGCHDLSLENGERIRRLLGIQNCQKMIAQ